VLIWSKTFSSQNLNVDIKTPKNFTLISKPLKKMQKISLQKSYRQKRCAKLELSSTILLTCKCFWQITFSRYTIFKLFPRIWNQRKILRFLYSYVKKEIKIFRGHGVHTWVFFGNSRMQIRKKRLDQFENFFNILKNIIWHLYAGESQQVMKITVTY
jgi:hypothetical protein